MKELLEIANTFETSKPIFTVDSSGEPGCSLRVRVSETTRYYPKLDPSNPLSALMNRKYEENFSRTQNRFIINKNEIAVQAMQTIRRHITLFIKNNLNTKAPQQSKLYRWAYRDMPKFSSLDNNLVMLYKYILSFCNDEMVFIYPHDTRHIDNTLAILQAMMEKHE